MKRKFKKRLILPMLSRKPEIIEAKKQADKNEDEFFKKYMQESEYRVSER